MTTTAKITNFVGVTTADILAAVEDGTGDYAAALTELAGRVMRDKPRPQAVSGFLTLVHSDDAPARPSGDVAAYKAWVSDAQKQAKALGAKASPKAKASAKPKPKPKRAAKPKASTDDLAAKVAAMTPAQRKALATFFAGL